MLVVWFQKQISNIKNIQSKHNLFKSIKHTPHKKCIFWLKSTIESLKTKKLN